jgi:drug/metabolite transporter (DMT)-like permease
LVILFFEHRFSIPDSNTGRILVLSLIAGGGVNIIGILAMEKGMRSGHNGTVWVIAQTAMIFPFFMGLVIFGEKLTLFRGIGIGLIVMNLIAVGKQKNVSVVPVENKGDIRISWLVYSFIAMLFFGMGQCLSSLPSYWKFHGLDPVKRTVFFQIGTAGILALMSVMKPMKPKWNSFKPAMLLAISGVLSSFFLFFYGLDRLAEAGVGSIGYPVAVGSCIIGFSIYSIVILRETMNKIQCGFMTLGILGMVLIAAT